MSKQITEQLIDSILNNDQESFVQHFEAALASKVSDALEAKKVEVASTLITPTEQVDEGLIDSFRQGYNAGSSGGVMSGLAGGVNSVKRDVNQRAALAKATFKNDYSRATSKLGAGAIPGAVAGAMDAAGTFIKGEPLGTKPTPTANKQIVAPKPMKEALAMPVGNNMSVAGFNSPKPLQSKTATQAPKIGPVATANKPAATPKAGPVATTSGPKIDVNAKITPKLGTNVGTIPGFNAPTKLEPKQAASSSSFKDEFKRQRDAGAKTFTWNGKSYTTDLAKPKTAAPKPETTSAPKPETPAAPTAATAKTPEEHQDAINKIDVYKGNGKYQSEPMNDNDRKVTAALDKQDADAAARNAASKSDTGPATSRMDYNIKRSQPTTDKTPSAPRYIDVGPKGNTKRVNNPAFKEDEGSSTETSKPENKTGDGVSGAYDREKIYGNKKYGNIVTGAGKRDTVWNKETKSWDDAEQASKK